MFLFHSCPPIGIDEGTTEGFGHRRQGLNMVESRNLEVTLHTYGHGLMVDHMNNGQSMAGQSTVAGLLWKYVKWMSGAPDIGRSGLAAPRPVGAGQHW